MEVLANNDFKALAIAAVIPVELAHSNWLEIECFSKELAPEASFLL